MASKAHQNMLVHALLSIFYSWTSLDSQQLTDYDTLQLKKIMP